MRAFFNAASTILRQSDKHILQNMERIDRIRVGKSSITGEVENSVEKAIEQSIIQRLHELYPSHRILSRCSGQINALERNQEEEHQYTWLLDPLDGSNNFMNGIPICSISLALYEGKRCVMGLVFQPITDQLFSAIAEHGALLDGKKIRAQRLRQDQKPLVAVSGDCSLTDINDHLKNFFKRELHIGQIRHLGCPSLALALHAQGSFDALFAHNLHICTAAAGMLIASEARAVIKKEQHTDMVIDQLISTMSGYQKM